MRPIWLKVGKGYILIPDGVLSQTKKGEWAVIISNNPDSIFDWHRKYDFVGNYRKYFNKPYYVCGPGYGGNVYKFKDKTK